MPVKAVGSFVPSLTRKAFEKFGFSTATLITDWARIAGAELAQYTMPDRLKWPRGAQGDGIYEDEGARRGATLILRVDPARALDVEYRARQILDRINTYFGYRAVEAVRLVQAPLESRSRPLSPHREGANPDGRRGSASAPPLAAPDETEGEDRLAAALARLEQGIRRQAARRA